MGAIVAPSGHLPLEVLPGQDNWRRVLELIQRRAAIDNIGIATDDIGTRRAPCHYRPCDLLIAAPQIGDRPRDQDRTVPGEATVDH